VLEKAGLTLIIMLSKTKKVFTTHLTVLCSIASYKLFYRITWRVETLSLLFVPPTERRRNGDYYEKDGKIVMPVSVQAHHSFVDGIHIGQFADMLQKYLESF